MKFTRESFLNILGINEIPDLYGKNFDAVMKEYDERGVWFLTDEFLDKIQSDFAMFDEKYDFVKDSIVKVRENELLARHSLLLYHMLNDRAPGEIANVTQTPVPPSEDERATYEMSAFFAELAFAPKMAEFLRSREQMKSGMFFSNESSNSQMLLYGRYMLNFNKLFDFEEKLDKINAMTYADAQETLSVMFNEDEKAVALVGNTDTPLSL